MQPTLLPEQNESPSRQAARHQDEASPLDTAAKRRGVQPFLLRSDKLEDNSSNLLLARKNNIINGTDFKSPIFKPEPGWGGQINKWLKNNFTRYIFPIISISILIYGIYRIIR